MNKRVVIREKPSSTADAWVNDRGTETPDAGESPVKMKRLTIDIPAELHRRFKTICAENDVRMADALRDILVREYMSDRR